MTPASTEPRSRQSATVNTATTPWSLTAASSTPATSVGVVDVVAAFGQPFATDSRVLPTAQAFTVGTVRSALSAPAVATAPPVAPAAQVAAPVGGALGFLNGIITKILNPFLAAAPTTPEPFSPVVWAVLGWVRRNFFNQAPTITYNPKTTVQTGQTVTGNIGATDPEHDTLKYTVTQAPTHGTLTIDQATGKFTYTPNEIDYDAVQTDSFTVSVSDGKFNLLSLLRPHTDTETINLAVQPPTIERVILNVPGVYYPWTPRFSEDGNSIYFTGTPATPGTPADARSELYNVSVDGNGLPQCLTCGLSPEITQDLFKPVPTYDGSGRVLIQVNTGSAASAVIYEPVGYNGNVAARLVPIVPPPSSPATGEPGGYLFGVSALQEPRISPDGQHILFSRLGAGQGFYFGVVPVVGDLVRVEDATGVRYTIANARVVAAAGEGKNWTPDGKGIVCLCGLNEQGNADNVIIDLVTGEVTRLNGNLDYDEDMDLSPNQEWMAVGSLRSFDGLTPLTRIVRPATLPLYIQGAVYTRYALPLNISNQEWLVRVEDDLQRENGIPLFVQGDGLPGEPDGDDWTARSMPGWNEDGTAVTFWEYNLDDPANTQARLVIANVKYTTSVGPVHSGDRLTPDSSEWSDSFPALNTYVLAPPPLPEPGTYAGPKGGIMTITETADLARPGYTLRTVQYGEQDENGVWRNGYVNEDGMILTGTESTSSQANLNTVYYLANIDVSGTHTGSLRANATINTLQRSIDGDITSVLDGDELHLLDQDRYELTLEEQ